MVQPRVGNGSVQIALRLPVELRNRVRTAADNNGRSMNSEIVYQLLRLLGAEDEKSGTTA
jgi:hypothetical protein